MSDFILTFPHLSRAVDDTQFPPLVFDRILSDAEIAFVAAAYRQQAEARGAGVQMDRFAHGPNAFIPAIVGAETWFGAPTLAAARGVTF